MDKLTLTVPEAAQMLGISKNLMYQLTRREDFPLLKIGARKLVPTKAFLKWLDKQTEDVLGGDNV